MHRDGHNNLCPAAAGESIPPPPLRVGRRALQFFLMINTELARVFERIADLLEIDGADGFRINSYRRAARTLK